MREEYDFLTDATRDGLTDNVKAAASGWGKCVSYIYGILNGEKKDPFAPFRSFYEGLCVGGVSTNTWDSDLAYIRQKHANKASTSTADVFRKRLHKQNAVLEFYMDAIADGNLDLDETHKLLQLIAIEKPMTAALEAALLGHRAKLEQAG